MKTKRILLAITALLFIAGGLLYYGSNFAKTMIHDQLSEQKIKFNSKEELEKAGESAYIIKFAGQEVDTGTEAKAYSEYIKGHIKKIANGKTYSEVSAEFQKDRNNQTLAAQRQNLFMGETLRGLLLSAYGWGVVGNIAYYASLAMFAAGILAIVAIFTLKTDTQSKTTKKKSAKK